MFASLLPDSFIEYATDIVFIAAFMAAVVYVVKRLIGFMQRAKDEVDDDE
jgi:hypothetical protein